MEMSKEAKAARREYYRQYKKCHKEKYEAAEIRFWERLSERNSSFKDRKNCSKETAHVMVNKELRICPNLLHRE